jgi:UDP-glucose 4-epimerase
MSKVPVLVTGGAGYIGSHAMFALKDAGWAVAVIDDLSSGVRGAVPEGVPFYEGNVADHALVERIFTEQGTQAIMHFAGSIVVPESVEDPLNYYGNNTVATHALLSAAVAAGVKHILFSSTAAVYGAPEKVPVAEDDPKEPINPYGASKLMTEWMLRDASAAHPFNYGALRYFNVAGADPQGRSGQQGKGSTHLIKVAVETAVGRRDHVSVFGTDYPTPDGTCIRDYIHVTDLADAHVRALEHLAAGKDSFAANLGSGRGNTVKEVIAAVEKVTRKKVPTKMAARRAGDPPALVADPTLAQQFLGWKVQHSLEDCVRSAWKWMQRAQR